MITRFITHLSLRFNPFSPRAKVCRSVLAQFGPSSFSKIKFDNKVLPRDSGEASSLKIKFQDGKEMSLDTEKLGFNDIMEEVDRHSRMLARKQELAG
ncbi:39S ribosomal protein L44, mitochondrial [Thelotrema lepadinum]|nr:39S ribosomal protein L44, mitochondrial [Thelotrema lepadinum]